ncbi:hypothetical protein QTP88_021670 [Uroleucon formosanum]
MFTDNWWMSIIAPCAIITTITYYYCVSTFKKWEKLNVSYIKPIPLFGNFLNVALGKDHPLEFYDRIYHEFAGHKYAGVYQMRTPFLMIRDPEIINDVLIKDFSSFPDRGFSTDFKANPMSNNLFNMENPQWKIIRNKLTPAFTSGKLKLMYDQIKECGDELIKILDIDLNKNVNEIELKNTFEKYSTDVIGTCLFGLKVNAIHDDKSPFRKYGKLVFKPSINFLIRELCGMITPAILKVIKVNKFPTAVTDFYHAAFKGTIKYRLENKIVRNDLVHCLIQARNDLVLNTDLPKHEQFSETQIVANAFLIFSAGFETTSSTLSYCLYELALNIHIQDKLRQEIQLNLSKSDGQIDNEFLMGLPYLDMVIAETLRKYPPLIALFRKASQTYRLNGNLTLEKGQNVVIPIYAMHYDSKYFADPQKFNPERFSPEERAKRPNGVYLPFGGGPRTCIGKRFALLEIKLTLLELLNKFEVLPCEKTEIPLKYSKNNYAPFSITKNNVDSSVLGVRCIIVRFVQTTAKAMYPSSSSATNWWIYIVTPCLVAVTITYYFCISTFNKWEKLDVPYVKPIPLFGNFFKVALAKDHPLEFYDKIYYKFSGLKYGGIFQMRTPYLMLRDPAIINNVLIKDFSSFPDRGIYSDFAANPLSDHLFFMENPRWKTIRNKLSPAFTSAKLKTMYDQIKECSDKLMENIDDGFKGKNDEIEVRDIMGKYSTDVIGTCAFGLKLNSICDDESSFRKYGKSIFTPSLRILFRELCLMVTPTLLKIIRVKDLPTDATDFFHAAFKETITYRLENKVVRNDFVNCLMQARNDLTLNTNLPKHEQFSETQIVANAFIMFIAGFETTSTTLSYCLYELALHIHIQDKVRQEIQLNLSKSDGHIDNEFLMDLPYLDMIIAETLRKYPPLIALFRKASQSYCLSDNLILEKGQKIVIPIYSLHYDSKYFADPQKFNPERFSPEEKAKRPNGVYFPFGGGPRICIGKRFAELEMKLALVEMLTKFEVLPCEKTEIPLKYSSKAFTLVPKHGIWLKFQKIV